MKHVNKIEVPEGIENAQRKGGVIVSYSIPNVRVLLIGHEQREVITSDENGEEKAEMKDFAFEVRVPHPVNRARAITAAEMAAYDLVTSLDVASFTAGLAKKFREGKDLQEIKDHDDFINWVKAELTAIGI